MPDLFFGRVPALRAFKSRFANRHMQNAVYYFGAGGTGKSLLLNEIRAVSEVDALRVVYEPIDFFETANQSVVGLQSSIIAQIGSPESFANYQVARAELEELKKTPDAERTGALASQEHRVLRLFLDSCQRATAGRDHVLLFDTFERVSEREVGRWFLNQFVAEVKNPIIVFAGRPDPLTLEMLPGNVLPFPLPGFSFPETLEYAKARRDYDPRIITDELLLNLWKAANDGIPLRLMILLKLASSHLLKDPSRLTNLVAVDEEIASLYADPPSPLNRTLWAMTYLRRRFDLPILQHIVQQGDYLRLAEPELTDLLDHLNELDFIKRDPERKSHLLHDEMQRIFQLNLLPLVDETWDITNRLFKVVVEDYYDSQILVAQEESKFALARQLRAEQLGYIIEKDPSSGLKRYYEYKTEIESTRDYEFEELIWGSVQEGLKALPEQVYNVFLERARWLRNQSRFERAEHVYAQMLRIFNQQAGAELEIRLGLGFVLFRQGKLLDAINQFELARHLVASDDIRTIATIHNNLGLVTRAAGRWDEALSQYDQAITLFATVNDQLWVASVYSNRGYIYSLKGQYERAKQQCRIALSKLDATNPLSREGKQFKMFALLNLGTAYRFSGDYESADYYYRESLKLAEAENVLEVTCQALEHIGINLGLLGRRKRVEQRPVEEIISAQYQAVDSLMKSLSIARSAKWRWALADGLSRLARILEEVHRLQSVIAPPLMAGLIGVANSIEVPEELEYQRKLLSPGPFRLQDWLGKATRLFELSALIADESGDIHRSLDSLMEAAILMLEQGAKAATGRLIKRMRLLRGFVYQEELFLTMAEITYADLEFEKENYGSAITLYGEYFPKLAKQIGYSTFLLPSRLDALETRLRRLLPANRQLLEDLCQELRAKWTLAEIASTRPEMLDLLDNVLLDARAVS